MEREHKRKQIKWKYCVDYFIDYFIKNDLIIRISNFVHKNFLKCWCNYEYNYAVDLMPILIKT